MKQIYCLRLFLYLMVIFPMTAFAQGTVSGMITEASTGNPLPGANIIIKGTSNGTTTDFDGNFNINVDAFPTTLVVSSVGYTTQEVNVESAQSISVALEDGVALSEIVLIGSRSVGRTAIDTPVPVDVIDVVELAAQGPQTTVNEILNYVAPSFTSTTQTVSDGTDHLDPASLRGLGPDQVLVLINGKRRHKSSLVNVNGTVGTGSVATDLNAIPAAAISKIEVLRDGAAAQYGSDAIAGVINIVLRENTNELNLMVNSGANFSKHSEQYDEGGMDGEKFQISANYGLDLGNKGGFINFTGSLENRGATNRSDSMQQPIFTMFDTATRMLGYDQAFAMNPSALSAYVGSLDSTLQAVYDNGIANGDDFLDIIASDAGPGGAQPITEYELRQRGLSRDDFRMKIGQSKLRSGKFMMNMELPVDDNGATFYANGGLSFREGLAAGFYRRPAYTDGRGTTAALENGFLPHIASRVVDKSFATGIKGNIGDWSVDFSNTFGSNSFDFTIENTANATLGASTPREFNAGGFAFSQNTTNLDLSNYYDDIFEGLNVAFGAEYRLENYQLIAGEEASWASYDVNGDVVSASTPDDDKVYSYFGRLVPGGSQVFPGYRPENATDANRNSYAGYLDVEADITEDFLVSAALRYEDYSDFGNTFNWKVASRYKVTDNIALRAAASTGFRAPDLHQIYFNATSTLFIAGVPNEVGTFANNSRLAQLLSIPGLEEETSQNYSLGFTANIPEAGLKVTVDGYIVNVDDRVAQTRNYSSSGQNAEVQQIFSDAAAGSAKFFMNAYDLESSGIDIVIDQKMGVGEGTLSNSLAASFRKFEVTDVVEVLGQEVLDDRAKGFVESAMPRTKLNLTNMYKTGNWNFLLRNVYFGEVNDPDFEGSASPVTYGEKIVTDLSIAYTLDDNLTLTVGANNLLDVYPDEVPTASNYGDQFIFSRRTSQFGFNGRYVFGRLTFKLK